jgi:hypothetical protein
MEHKGTPIRFPAVAELQVDSRDRYTDPIQFANAPTTSSDILFPAKQSLLLGYFTRIGVSDLQLEWRTPNINSYNNTVQWNSEYVVSLSPLSTFISTYTATLPIDFYNRSSLIQAVCKEMSLTEQNGVAAPPLYTPLNPPPREQERDCIVQKNPFYVSTFGTEFQFLTKSEFNSSMNQSTIVLPSTQKFFNTTQIYGFQTLLNQDNLLIDPLSDLCYTRYFDIVSDNLVKYSKVKDSMTRQKQGQTNVIARVYMTPYNNKERFPCNEPFNMAVDYSTPKNMRWLPLEYLNDFDLKLYDQYGEVLFWAPVFSTEYQLNIHASET